MAYLYDPDNTFPSKLNDDMADLEALNEFDQQLLQQMVRNHFSYTSSKTALDLLNNWDEELKNFVKVMPRDYKRVLEQKAELPNVSVKVAEVV